MEEKRGFKLDNRWLALIGMILLAVVVSFSILRERIVTRNRYQVVIIGQGKVAYEPDMANVILGIQVERIPKAEDAMNQLNAKMKNVMTAVKSLGVKEENITTETYSIYPQYDYKNGSSVLVGYSASQKIIIKAENVKKGSDVVSQIISSATNAGANQVMGIDFNVSNPGDLKQKARLLAMEDAKDKAKDLFKSAGIKKPGKIVGWYENFIKSPDVNSSNYGIGGRGGAMESAPQVPGGTQEIVVEMGVNYEID